jgi:hypothetical protein
MALVTLVHPREVRQISAVPLLLKCDLFKDNPGLVGSPYTVTTSVPLNVFQDFVCALEDKPIDITPKNFFGLSELTREFGFSGLAVQLNTQRPMAEAASSDLAREGRIAALEDQVSELLKTTAATTEAHEKAMDAANARIAELERVLLRLVKVVPGYFESTIVEDFPEIFAGFRNDRFKLLWRGSRDGFGAAEFHARCDRHSNTLTLIEDSEGNIFGGYTPVEWESRVWNGKNQMENNTLKSDESLKSFLFTLKNPHGVAPRRFVLKPEMRHSAIAADARLGPVFTDLAICDQSNSGPVNGTKLGVTYVNGTSVDGATFFAGAKRFVVKEIEVFELVR